MVQVMTLILVCFIAILWETFPVLCHDILLTDVGRRVGWDCLALFFHISYFILKTTWKNIVANCLKRKDMKILLVLIKLWESHYGKFISPLPFHLSFLLLSEACDYLILSRLLICFSIVKTNEAWNIGWW